MLEKFYCRIKKGNRLVGGHNLFSYEYYRKGEATLLLHGGLSSTESWDWTILPALTKRHVFAYDRSAHGRTAARDGYYHFDFQTDEAILFIENVIKEPVHLIGWSDGGIISLMVALKRPDLVKSIISIGTNFHFNATPQFEEEPVIELTDEDRARWAARSPEPAHMQETIIRKAYEVWSKEPTMTTSELSKISCPVLVLCGDDEPFSNHHTVDLFEALPNAQLAIVPGTSHAVVKEVPEIVQSIIKRFNKGLNKNNGFPFTKMPRIRKVQQEQLLEQSGAAD
jgi:pimeloyl-ACP methyl ester carboxylesterase